MSWIALLWLIVCCSQCQAETSCECGDGNGCSCECGESSDCSCPSGESCTLMLSDNLCISTNMYKRIELYPNIVVVMVKVVTVY